MYSSVLALAAAEAVTVSDIPSSVIAALGSIGGVIGLEVTRRWLSRSKEKSDVATTIRAELRTEIAGLKKEIDDLEEELTRWKDKYYTLRESYLNAQTFVDQQHKNVHMPKLPEADNDPDTRRATGRHEASSADEE
jgi:septal ring factor EnvC (AmiA/AmiB activator)